MKRPWLRLASLVLVLCLSIGLTACGGGADKNAEVVRKAYHEILKEEPSKQALDHWTKELAGGMSEEQLRKKLFQLKAGKKPVKGAKKAEEGTFPELDDRQFLYAAFNAYYFRIPTKDEMTEYLKLLRSKKITRSELNKKLKESDEHKAIWSRKLKPETVKTITDLHQRIFNAPINGFRLRKFGYQYEEGIKTLPEIEERFKLIQEKKKGKK